MKTPERRIRKYIIKVEPETIKEHIANQKDLMVEQITGIFPSLYETELRTKQILDIYNPPPIVYVMYLCFTRELWKKVNKTRLSGYTLWLEATIVKNKWAWRGLDDLLLRTIAEQVFNLILPEAPSIR